MGRLVRAAAVEQANKGALATHFCKSSKGRQFAAAADKRGLQVASGDFAEDFARIYTARCA
ncbi:TPA: hypothetical protein ACH3X1_000377 [Trebouxia sp. C0004]